MGEKYTAGPWVLLRALRPVDGQFDYGIAADIDGKRYCIAETYGRAAENVLPPAFANARLISAAPDLLAVAQMILAAVEGGDEMAVVDAARAAIEKATIA